MKITIQKQSDCYLPYDDEALEFTKRKPENSLYVVDIVESRNPEYHRRAFKMLHILFNMIDTDLSFEPWRKMLTIKAGYFTAIGSVDVAGRTFAAVVADSLSYEKMEQEQFRKVWLAIHQAFCNKYGDKLSMDELTEWSQM